jgi:hypothetical protein
LPVQPQGGNQRRRQGQRRRKTRIDDGFDLVLSPVTPLYL